MIITVLKGYLTLGSLYDRFLFILSGFKKYA